MGHRFAHAHIQDVEDGIEVDDRMNGIELVHPPTIYPTDPIAVSTPTDEETNQLNLFFSSDGNQVTQIVATSADFETWNWGPIAPHSEDTFAAQNGSQLAAARRQCSNCSESLAITFENDQQEYWVANSTDDWNPIADTNGTIHEYRMDSDDAYTFHWLGEVE
ncbi:hypothetical protein F4780DRAFT_70470 [Xylariomycetidae sp. FL0641]|nr:hypothetical protein F4780DRAFT_70470 [Xylariomycetidae sp. FL0641]